MTELFEKKTENEVKVEKREDGSYVIGSKVYKDEQALLQSRIEADRHIGLLEAENKEHRELLQRREEELKILKTLDERLSKNTSGREEDKEDEYEYRQDSRQETERIDPDALAESIYQKVQDKSAKDQKRDQFEKNKVAVASALSEAFDGDVDTAREAFQEYKRSDEFDEDLFNSMMLKSPKTLAKLIAQAKNPNAVVSFGNIPSSRSSTKQVDTSGARGWSYWKKVMADKPRFYGSVEGFRERKKDMELLGEKFLKS